MRVRPFVGAMTMTNAGIDRHSSFRYRRLRAGGIREIRARSHAHPLSRALVRRRARAPLRNVLRLGSRTSSACALQARYGPRRAVHANHAWVDVCPRGAPDTPRCGAPESPFAGRASDAPPGVRSSAPPRSSHGRSIFPAIRSRGPRRCVVGGMCYHGRFMGASGSGGVASGRWRAQASATIRTNHPWQPSHPPRSSSGSTSPST